MNSSQTQRKSIGVALWRALALRCPVCGRGKVFRNWITMHHHCDHCGLKYERAPGYFLGSIYFNYGVTTVIVVAAFLVLFFTEVLSQSTTFTVLLAFSLLFPVWFFRYARGLWMAFDHFYDPAGQLPTTQSNTSASNIGSEIASERHETAR